jgi:hypothetical protein
MTRGKSRIVGDALKCRDEWIKMRLTADEKKAAYEKAGRVGMTVSEYIRSLIRADAQVQYTMGQYPPYCCQMCKYFDMFNPEGKCRHHKGDCCTGPVSEWGCANNCPRCPVFSAIPKARDAEAKDEKRRAIEDDINKRFR